MPSPVALGRLGVEVREAVGPLGGQEEVGVAGRARGPLEEVGALRLEHPGGLGGAPQVGGAGAAGRRGVGASWALATAKAPVTPRVAPAGDGGDPADPVRALRGVVVLEVVISVSSRSSSLVRRGLRGRADGRSEEAGARSETPDPLSAGPGGQLPTGFRPPSERLRPCSDDGTRRPVRTCGGRPAGSYDGAVRFEVLGRLRAVAPVRAGGGGPAPGERALGRARSSSSCSPCSWPSRTRPCRSIGSSTACGARARPTARATRSSRTCPSCASRSARSSSATGPATASGSIATASTPSSSKRG